MEESSDLSDIDLESPDQDLFICTSNTFEISCYLDSIEPLLPQPQLTKAGISSNIKKTRSCSEFEKQTLSMFIDKNNKWPKKEYIRAQVIRGVKRAMRDVSLNKKPRKKLHSVDFQSFESTNAWNDFSDTVKKNENFVSLFSSTESGPLTDGKSSRKYQSNEKSFNDKFCSRFFSEIMKTEIYSKYLSLVFIPFTCKSLNLKFNIRPVCHNQKVCSSDCQVKWEKFREYISSRMIEDLRQRKREVP